MPTARELLRRLTKVDGGAGQTGPMWLHLADGRYENTRTQETQAERPTTGTVIEVTFKVGLAFDRLRSIVRGEETTPTPQPDSPERQELAKKLEQHQARQPVVDEDVMRTVLQRRLMGAETDEERAAYQQALAELQPEAGPEASEDAEPRQEESTSLYTPLRGAGVPHNAETPTPVQHARPGLFDRAVRAVADALPRAPDTFTRHVSIKTGQAIGLAPFEMGSKELQARVRKSWPHAVGPETDALSDAFEEQTGYSGPTAEGETDE